MARWWCLAVVMLLVSVSKPAFCDPQTNFLGSFSSNFKFSDVSASMRVVNSSLTDLRSQISENNKHFATAEYSPMYTMVQCRNYLSTADCVACFDAAVLKTRNFSYATGVLVIYDGCFLRYEDSYFYDQKPSSGFPVCGTRTARKQDIFNSSAQQLLNELLLATPRINGFYAAANRGESDGGGPTIYGVAQCAETLSQGGCQDCLSRAYNNIQSCLPNFADGRGVVAGCFLRYSDTSFYSDNQTTDIMPFLGGVIGNSGKKKSKNILLGSAVGSTVGIILVIGALFFLYRPSWKTKAWRRAIIFGASQLKGLEYKYNDLKVATGDFSEKNKIGSGGFGDVYKVSRLMLKTSQSLYFIFLSFSSAYLFVMAEILIRIKSHSSMTKQGTLQNGDVVAVKKLAMISNRVKDNFLSEVSLITNVYHSNLIRLLGYSGNANVLLLVYEYMANASLDRYIYGEKKGMLNWKQRVDIIFGTARGLAYLHEVRIIHRDIKSSNILLDEYFQPKIADFGLAKFLHVDKSHRTTKFAGTLGYTAPEYAIHGHLSEKVDTYSFGIVILEIISGRKSSEIQVEPVTEFLLEQAWKLYQNEEHLGLVDKTLDPKEYEADEMRRMLDIALVCTQSPANRRPTMSEVVLMLSSKNGFINPRPQYKPTTITYLDKRAPIVSSSSNNATMSLSHFSGR